MAYEGMDFKEWIGEYPVHPVASLFPMIGDDALNALAEDIKKNGQREPISRSCAFCGQAASGLRIWVPI